MLRNTLAFLSIILMALAFVPSAAHLFEMPNKVGMSEGDYFIAQGIYRGWARFGIVLVGALVSDLVLAAMLRGHRTASILAFIGALSIATVLATFFIWIYPANQATENWTVVTENWPALRTHWEYGHAANAILTFLGLCCVTLAALSARNRG